MGEPTVRRYEDAFIGREPRLAVRVWDGSGQPFVLLHGLTHNLAAWSYLVDQLDSNARIVAVDFRSHGRSVRHAGHAYSDYTDDLLQAAKLAGPRPLVIGHSWGARVALWAAAHHRDTFSGVVALDQALWNSPPPAAGDATTTEPAPISDAQLTEVLAQYADSPRWLELVQRQYQRTDDGWSFTFRNSDGRALMIAEAAAQPVEDLYARISCPVLMIFAADDDDFGFAPPRGRDKKVDYLAKRHAGLEIAWIDGDHGFHVDHPSETAARQRDPRRSPPTPPSVDTLGSPPP